jgi:hypothetical protein
MVAHTAWSLSPRAPHVLAPSTAGGDTFLLHNPFSNTTVPLPGMDAVCAKAAALGEWFHVFKVLLMSSSAAAADIVVIVSQSRNYPFALSLPGKGQDDTWTPEPHAPPFMHIIDIAFVGDDNLYGITRAEDLFLLRSLLGAWCPSVADPGFYWRVCPTKFSHMQLGTTIYQFCK